MNDEAGSYMVKAAAPVQPFLVARTEATLRQSILIISHGAEISSDCPERATLYACAECLYAANFFNYI
jgi:hypothetical protein